MKTVILAGGRGTRLGEATRVKPKPMVEIGGAPLLVHIMKIYSYHGHKDFLIALGYLGEVIKDYFLNYRVRSSDIEIDLPMHAVSFDHPVEDWLIRLVDTGQGTMTGGRVHRLEGMLRPEGRFMLTYGDGLSSVDVGRLLEFHASHGRLATVTAVRPPARFGALTFDGDQVVEFCEKPQTGEGWINGGFFVFEPAIFEYLRGDETILEQEPLAALARDGQLMGYRHEGFWYPMDTARDRDVLEELWRSGRAPRKVW